MHPYFAQELARERQTGTARHGNSSDTERNQSKAAPAPKASLTARARHSLGRALVALGTRLLGGGPVGAELFTTRR